MNSRTRILITFSIFLCAIESHAQIVHETFRAYPGIASNWMASSEKLNDSTYLLTEYTSRSTQNGLQFETALMKLNKNWQITDSIVVNQLNFSLLHIQNGLIYWVANTSPSIPSLSILLVLDSDLNILRRDTLNGNLPDLASTRIHDIPNGVGILGIDRNQFYSYLFEVSNGGQNIIRKDIKQGNRNIKLVGDFCYLPSSNKYALVGAIMRQDTLRAGSDIIDQLGLFDTSLQADTIKFIPFYPTTGAPLKRAAALSEFSPEILLVNDSTFFLFAHGKHLTTITSDPVLAYQMSVSRWSSDLSLLGHEMYGRRDTSDALTVQNSGMDFQGNVWLGFRSERHVNFDYLLSRGEIGLLQFNTQGVKLREEYIKRVDKRLFVQSARAFGDSILLLSGYYYDFNSTRPLGSRDAFFMVVNPFGISSSTQPIKGNKLDVIVYPNPSKGIIKFDLEGEIEYIKIKDIQGKILLQSVVKEVDLSGLPEGMYIYHLRTRSGKINTGKVIINNS